jgi:hypothetical protein
VAFSSKEPRLSKFLPWESVSPAIERIPPVVRHIGLGQVRIFHTDSAIPQALKVQFARR